MIQKYSHATVELLYVWWQLNESYFQTNCNNYSLKNYVFNVDFIMDFILTGNWSWSEEVDMVKWSKVHTAIVLFIMFNDICLVIIVVISYVTECNHYSDTWEVLFNCILFSFPVAYPSIAVELESRIEQDLIGMFLWYNTQIHIFQKFILFTIKFLWQRSL